MTTGIVESSASSASISILSMILWILWKRWKDKTNVIGCLTPIGKSYAERNLNEVDKCLFFDIDSFLCPEKCLVDVPMNERRLQFYPKAQTKIIELKTHYKNHSIIILSSDFELLKYLRLHKRTIAYIPTKKFFADNVTKIAERQNQMEKLALQYRLQIKDKFQRQFCTFDELGKELQNIVATFKGKK